MKKKIKGCDFSKFEDGFIKESDLLKKGKKVK